MGTNMDDHGLRDDEYDDLTRRLADLGAAPIPPGVAARTRARLATPARRRGAWRTKWVAAAAVAGFVMGGVGLAAADVLPPGVQDAAHNALNTVGVHVPPGHNRYNDPSTCPGGPYRNHGAYVRAHHDDPNAGASPCGKPLNAVNHPTGATDGSEPGSSEGHGKPSSPPGQEGKGPHGKGNGNGSNQGHGKPDDHGDDESTSSSTASTTTVP